MASKTVTAADMAEYKRLRNVVNARAWRGQAGAATLRVEVGATKTIAEKLTLLKRNLLVGAPGGSVAPSNEPWEPSKATQVHALALQVMPRMQCVVKSFPAGSVGLRRTLAVYAHLRETGTEEAAPVPRLLKIVPSAAKAEAKAKAKAKAKTKAKAKAKGKTKAKAKAKAKATVDLWFEYCGADAEKANKPGRVVPALFIYIMSLGVLGSRCPLVIVCS